MFVKNIELKSFEDGCLLNIEFIDYGILNEEYFIRRNNKEAYNSPSNPIMNYKVGEEVYINLKEWEELFKNEYIK